MKLFYEHYIRLAHIGKGANAHVYKVRHAELGYVRAIKVLNEYIEDKSESIYQSFLKECKTLLTIGNGCHPNIVRIYGPDLIDNHAIVEMDCIQGKTMDSYIKQKGFVDYEEVKTFVKDIVGALAYTHYDIYDFLKDPEADDLQIDPRDGSKYLITPEKEAELVQKYGIVHNDLHSNNIMRRDYDGRFVLLDFGLAVQAGKCVKSSRLRDGSPEYQAPEKFDSDIIDPRSDVYSLGILMYEILAGRVPFEIQLDGNGNVSQRAINTVLNQHQRATPPPILPLRKAAFEKQMPGAVYERDYPEWLDAVIMKCLAKKPEDRYKNGKELLETINGHLNNDKPDNTEIIKLRDTIKELRDTIARLKDRTSTPLSPPTLPNNRNKDLPRQWREVRARAHGKLSIKDARAALKILQDFEREVANSQGNDELMKQVQEEIAGVKKELERVSPTPKPVVAPKPKPGPIFAAKPKPVTPEVKPGPKNIKEDGKELLQKGKLKEALDWYIMTGDIAKSKLLSEIVSKQQDVEARKQSVENSRNIKNMYQINRFIRALSDYIGLCDKAGLCADEYKSLLREYTKMK